MREQVIARHLGSGETRQATIDDETSKLTDSSGNDLDYRFWTYDDIDPSPGFLTGLAIVGLILFVGVIFIASGASK